MSQKKKRPKAKGAARGTGTAAARAAAPAPRAAPSVRRLVLGAAAVMLAVIVGAAAWRGAQGNADSRTQPAPPAAAARRFDGERAYELLKKQVAFGPRVPGQPGHTACRDFLLQELKLLADEASLQEFTQNVGGRRLPMANLLARWKPKSPGGVLLAAHWDTRPTADQDPDPSKRGQPIAGANDGASGVAVLLELARRFKAAPPPVPVLIVLFDGEDYGPGLDRMFLGSRHFAARLPDNCPREGVLLDMVGDRDLRIPQEWNSLQGAPDVIREVYDVAHRLGYRREFPKEAGGEIQDDHVPLLRRGLKVIDLIDFDYPPWHTLADTPDKCSAKSLQAVGDVVGEWVYGKR